MTEVVMHQHDEPIGYSLEAEEEDSYDAGPSSLPPTTSMGHPSTSSRSPSTAQTSMSEVDEGTDGDGFLGHVARWGDGSKSGGPSVRTSRMLGNKFNLSPPPPPGPPPSEPPPLPPSDAGSPRAHTRQHPFRRTTSGSGRPPTPPPPALPPPTSALPALPTTSTAQSAPMSRRANSVSSRSTSSKRHSGSPPQPSPRSSSLFSPVQMSSNAVAGPSTASDVEVLAPSPSPSRSSSKAPRTPSRHLLQAALDLAQKAVEMDKSNDVVGALAAYREAVSRLRSVMERVGVEPTRADGKSVKNASGKSEEEGRTLRGIHDAYVARIQLLSSYENGDPSGASETPTSSHFETTAHPSTSTATLVPDALLNGRYSEPTSGERTPRPSLDELGNQFGDMRVSSSAHPYSAAHGQEAVEPASQPISRNTSGSSVRIPPRGASVGQGSHSPPVTAQSYISDFEPTSPSIASTRSRGSKRRIQRPSIGLESELDLPISEEEAMETMTQESDDVSRQDSYDIDRPLPPLPSTSPVPNGRPGIHARQASLGSGANMLVSQSTAQGTISQRRKNGDSGIVPSASGSTITLSRLASVENIGGSGSKSATAFPHRSNSSTQLSGLASFLPPRLRTRSGPGRPISTDEVPPLPTPTLTHKLSYGSQRKLSLAGSFLGSRLQNDSRSSIGHSNSLAPPVSISSQSALSTPRSFLNPASTSGSLISPLPENQPAGMIHRPFHLLRLLHRSMDPSSSGSYLTGRLHISPAVWRPAIWPKASAGSKALGPPKIVAQDVKVRIIEALELHLDMVRHAGSTLLDGEREYPAGTEVPADMARAAHRVAEELCAALDGLDEEMDQSYKMLTKGGVVVGPWKGKRSSNSTSWGSKFSKTMDKMTSNKALDSPDRYVDLLFSFCANLQSIDEHLACVIGPGTLAYASLNERTHGEVETRLMRAGDFVRLVVVPFILDDFKQFFLRYLKGGVRYMED